MHAKHQLNVKKQKNTKRNKKTKERRLMISDIFYKKTLIKIK
jgi:hypothetical protein